MNAATEKNGNGGGKISVNTIMGVATAASIIFGGLLGYVRPMQADIETLKTNTYEVRQIPAIIAQIHGLEEEIRLQETKIVDLQKSNTVATEKFKEIDTQIAWAADIENIHKRHVLQLLGLVWQKTFSVPLPMPTPLDDGPTKIKSQ